MDLSELQKIGTDPCVEFSVCLLKVAVMSLQLGRVKVGIRASGFAARS
jgi:hypothetical protein